jgi:hypothetical protein
MRFIIDIFIAHLGRFVVIYLDDILIFSQTWDTHMQHVRQVLQILQEHKLQVKEKKSYFDQTSIPYLVFVVSSEGIQPDPACIQALKQWPLPSSAKELKIFLGGINFYRKFFPLFQIFLNLCIISQILHLHSTRPNKKLLTFLSSKMPSAHPLFYIFHTSPNPLRLSLMPHNMLLVS